MPKGLVIVESPAKAKTLSTFLGKDYKVIASYGHIRDLPSKNGSVDPNNNFKMLWEFSTRGKKQITEIIDELKFYNNLFLATDPDREGEAISWHILEVLKQKKLIKNKTIQRVVFHEITKSAVSEAFKNPRELDQNLVDAYLARRILDYLVGFSLSPVLWRKMPGAKSAGRVQSVALRLIVERELEIFKFKPEEFWTLHNLFSTQEGNFLANLTHINGKKLDKLDIKTEDQAEAIRQEISTKKYVIDTFEKKQTKRNPYAPFTTSTLQQGASYKLGFSAKHTMQIAQKLYEGISVNGTMTGLITYMRTDSTNLSPEALKASREYISSAFEKEYLPNKERIYKTKTKNAQEAHEAIRPTDCGRTPDSIKQFLTDDEFKLYELIWKRTIASQMANALLDQVSVTIKSIIDKSASDKSVSDKSVSDKSVSNEYTFKVTGSTIAFDGFLKLYKDTEETEDELKLPKLEQNTQLELKSSNKNQHFTQPPSRFNEASVVKKLEELGIGRPSTYATIINVIQERNYATLQKRAFIPENIGVFVVSFLKNFFKKYVEYTFTANLEEELDNISNGKIGWETVLDNFWTEFNQTILNTDDLTGTKVIDTLESELQDYIFRGVDDNHACHSCDTGKLHLKLSKFGSFLGCSNYPDCRYAQSISDNPQPISFNSNQNYTVICTDYNNDNIFLKKGPFGPYLEWENTKDSNNTKKPKRLPIPKFITSPDTLTTDDIMALIDLPKDLGIHSKLGKNIVLCLGRFGPYLVCDKHNYNLPKEISSLHINLSDAEKIIE